ncbi:hypothetical protein THAOC_34762, partial [Thalassiosira oceanica]
MSTAAPTIAILDVVIGRTGTLKTTILTGKGRRDLEEVAQLDSSTFPCHASSLVEGAELRPVSEFKLKRCSGLPRRALSMESQALPLKNHDRKFARLACLEMFISFPGRSCLATPRVGVVRAVGVPALFSSSAVRSTPTAVAIENFPVRRTAAVPGRDAPWRSIEIRERETKGSPYLSSRAPLTAPGKSGPRGSAEGGNRASRAPVPPAARTTTPQLSSAGTTLRVESFRRSARKNGRSSRRWPLARGTIPPSPGGGRDRRRRLCRTESLPPRLILAVRFHENRQLVESEVTRNRQLPDLPQTASLLTLASQRQSKVGYLEPKLLRCTRTHSTDINPIRFQSRVGRGGQKIQMMMQPRDNKRARLLSAALDVLGNDLLVRCASYLGADGLAQLGRTSARFGLPQAGQQRSLANEAARQRFRQSATDEDMSRLPKYDEESDVALLRALGQLRRPLCFDKLEGNCFSPQEHPARVTHTGRPGWSTAVSGHEMRGGRHFVEFEINHDEQSSHIYLGVIRPVSLTDGIDLEADWEGHVSPVLVSSSFKPAVAEKLRSQRTAKWGVSDVHCCSYYCNSGRCYWTDWNTEDNYSGWQGQEGFRGSGTIGLLLDLDEGTLSVFKDGRRLGVMKEGL